MAAADLYLPLAYTPEPSSTAPEPPPDPEAPPELKECSVRGCHQMVSTSASTKMCETCRGRHRVYATTKRMKRKLEKAALQSIVGNFVNQTQPTMDTQQEGSSGSAGGIHHHEPSAPSGPSEKDDQSAPAAVVVDIGVTGGAFIGAYPATAWPNWKGWGSSIDPRLFESQVPRASSASQLYSSSELANALTLPPSSLYCRPEETMVIGIPEAVPSSSHQPSTTARASSNPSDSSQDDDSRPARYCSVKGCKAVIPGSYAFKMCPPCRNRYRGYGNTKRRKWKAERDAFDRELATMRNNEDERRKTQGLLPMVDGSEELRLWEMSVLDEQIPLPAEVVTALEAVGIRSDGKINVPSGMDSKTDDIVEHFARVADKVSAAKGEVGLPALSARMCTVSHCHKILPGYYRYKRCEQHRLQNRHHSKLKRVREKVLKALGPEDGAHVISVNLVLASNNTSTELGEGGEVASSHQQEASKSLLNDSQQIVSPSDGDGKTTKHASKRPLSCMTKGCQNSLSMEKRWKHCDFCRLVDRRKKTEERKAAAVATTGGSTSHHGSNDVREAATVEATDHQDPDIASNRVSPSPDQHPQSFARPSDEGQQAQLQGAHGDADMNSAAVRVEMQPDAEMYHCRSNPQPLTDQRQTSTTAPANLDPSFCSQSNAGLRMVNLTAHTYENSDVPFRWSDATAIAKASQPSVAAMPAAMTNAWELEMLVTESVTAKAPTQSTLTFREYCPSNTSTATASTPGLSRSLPRQPYVTVEPFKALLEHPDANDQDGSGGGNHPGASGGIPPPAARATGANGEQEQASSSVGTTLTSPDGNEATGSPAVVNSSNTEHPPSASISRLDIPRVATSTAESFRYYRGPRDLTASAQAVPRTTSESFTREVTVAQPPAPEATDEVTSKSPTARKRKSKEAMNDAAATPAASIVPTINATPPSPYPGYPYSHLQTGYPTYPVFLAQPVPGAYGYLYPPPASSQKQAAAYPICSPAGKVTTFTSSYPQIVPAPYALAYPPHACPTGSSSGSTLPFPYNTYMPVQSTPAASSDSYDSHNLEPSTSGTETSSPPTSTSTSSRSSTVSSRSTSELETGPKFAYYHPGIGTTDSPDPGDAAAKVRKKRRTVDPAWLEKMRLLQQNQQQADLSAVGRGPLNAPHVFPSTAGATLTPLPPESNASTGSHPRKSPREADATSTGASPELQSLKDEVSRSLCHGKNCAKQLPPSANAILCDKCRLKLRKLQERTKVKHKLLPYKSIVERFGNSDTVRIPTPLALVSS